MSHSEHHYTCPNCASALTALRGRTEELFCRTCGTAVVKLGGDRCLYMVPGSSGPTRDGVLLPRAEQPGR